MQAQTSDAPALQSSGNRHSTARHLTANNVRQIYDISRDTLRKWAGENKITVVRPGGPTGRRLYDLESIRTYIGHIDAVAGAAARPRERIIYARVSSAKQEAAGDLGRQIDALRALYPTHELISDVASGLDFHRQGLCTLLERVHRGVVEEVVVVHRDRLCCFALELVEFIFAQAGTRLVVIPGSPIGDGPSGNFAAEEIADDLLTVTTVLVARQNGRRTGENRRKRKRDHEGKGGEEGVAGDGAGGANDDEGGGSSSDSSRKRVR